MRRSRSPQQLANFRDLRCRLDDEQAEAVRSYHQTLQEQGIGGYASDTIKELIHMGLQQVPPSGNLGIRDRHRAYNEVRQYLIGRLFTNLKDIMGEMRDACETGAQLHAMIPTDNEPTQPEPAPKED